MSSKSQSASSTPNREIIDDTEDRLSIHTHRIDLTQAHLPYQAVAGKRLGSRKHFSVYADQIRLSGALENPGRDIELHAREIIIDGVISLDTSGADAAHDFAPGEPATQKDITPGAAGTDGADGTQGGDAGKIRICAQRLVRLPSASGKLAASDLASIGAKLLSDHPPRIDNVSKLAPFEFARTRMFGPNEVSLTLDQGLIEGLAQLVLASVGFDGSSRRIRLSFELPALKLTGTTKFSGSMRIVSSSFGCRLIASAAIGRDGKIGTVQLDSSLIMTAPIRLSAAVVSGDLSPAMQQTVREQIQAHVRAPLIDVLLQRFADQIHGATLGLLARGGPGGRGQDGHAGVRGESGADGAQSNRTGVLTNGNFGFPQEAIGKDGQVGGRAGSPGRSGPGGRGGQIEVNVIEPIEFALIYSVDGGDGGGPANPGEPGAGGLGGQGAMTRMVDARTGKALEDRRATNGHDGPQGPVAQGHGNTGPQGAAGQPLHLNGKAFSGAQVPAFGFSDLAPYLSLSQLMITQNATDLDFLNAANEPALNTVARGYEWLISINARFADPDAAAAQAVGALESKVRAGIHNSAVISLMRLQQGLDFYGHSYNWTPVLNLENLMTRTGQLIQLGKVVEDQYNRYLDKAATDKARMRSFIEAKQNIDRKLGDFLTEIDKLRPQIEDFETEVRDYSEDLRHQRTVLLEGELKFKDELIKFLQEEEGLGFEQFLDMLATVIGCAGGVVSGVGGIKTAFDAVKKATEFSKKVSSVVNIFKQAKATIESVRKAYSTVKDYLDESNPNAAKILVDGEEFDALLKKYLGKFDAAGELRKAMDYYLELVQARNMAAYNYTTLVAQLLNLKTQHDQVYDTIQHLNAEVAGHQDNVLPIYTAFVKDAYEDLQRNLLRNIYQENRAYQYWALRDRQLKTSDLNIATLAATHERLISEIDGFREDNEAFSDFTQKLTISAERYPNEFAAMLASRSLAFRLRIRDEPGFMNMSHVIARKFRLEFPEIDGGDHVLFVNLVHSGQALLNSDVNLDKPGVLHQFSHRPRIRPYRIDYKDQTNVAGGNLGEGDQGYIGLSPFAVWRIDFDINGNQWLDLSKLKTVILTFEGRMLGPGRRLN